MQLNLKDVFELGLRDLYESSRRGDEELAHVSHLGKCLLQTRLSRAKAPEIEKNARGLQMLMKGLHDEEYIVTVLKIGLLAQGEGWEVERYVIDLDLKGHIDVELARMECVGCSKWMSYLAGPAEWQCLPDCSPGEKRYGELERAIVEVKTTQWRERWEQLGEISTKTGKPIKTKVLPGPYPEPSQAHRFQALGYTKRRNLRWYAIFQWDRALHGFHQYPRPGEWYDADDAEWSLMHAAWTKEVLDKTDPTTDPVEMGIATYADDGRLIGRPPEEWMCGYCDYAQCAKNVNKNNAEHGIDEVQF